MKFKSKIDWWIHLIFATLPLTTVWLAVSYFMWYRSWIVGSCALLFILIDIFLFPIWTSTYYVLDENELIISCGFLRKIKIPYKSIGTVNETRCPLASYAMSLDRIEIKFTIGKLTDMILISPQNKREFMQRLNEKIAP